MSFPSHLIMDLNFNKKTLNSPYWITNFTNINKTNPIFLDEINTKKLTNEYSNTYKWVFFLKNNNNVSYNNRALLLHSNTTFNSLNKSSDTPEFTPENLININFLRYERLYTKLKYSRSPAFDIVSGGAAALLAGFVGFLISEKFGFELVDSGDFYYLFMYIVFGVFMLKPLLYIININESVTKTLSYRNVINFFSKIMSLSILYFKK